MRRSTKTLLTTLAVFAVGVFLGSADAMAMAPECVDGKLCGNTCIEVTKACFMEMRPTLESCQVGVKNFGIWMGEADLKGEGFRLLVDTCLASIRSGMSLEGWETWHCLANATPTEASTIGQCFALGG